MLPSLTAVFLLGLLCGSQLLYFPLTILSLSGAAAVGLHVCERARCLDARRTWFLYGSFLAGILYWSATVQVPPYQSFPTTSADSFHTIVTGRIIEPVQHGPHRQTLILETEGEDSKRKRVRILWHYPGQALYCGDRVLVRGKFHPPTGTRNPGGFDYALHLERQGIDLV